MHSSKRNTLMSVGTLATALWLLSGCNETSTVTTSNDATTSGSASSPSSSVASGTRIDVALGGPVSSKTANVGDAWHGTVNESVSASNGGSIPAGSQVDGVVTAVRPAKKGSRAMLELGVRGIQVNGDHMSIAASSEPVIAGSTRARNLGAIAGSAAAGALIGKAVGDGKNGAVGGVVGGATAAGVVAASDGYQVVLTDGAVMSFTVSNTVAMR